MGLHNKNPDYFYDKSNLFNTYLGYSAPPRGAREGGSRASRPRSLSRRPPKAILEPMAALGESTAVEQLIRFLKRRLTPSELAAFLQALATYRDVPAKSSDARTWPLIRAFLCMYFTEGELARYLHVLQSRHSRGETLVRIT